jgi:hypothetical protein
MAVTIVRYTTKPERADENQGLVEAVFRELAATDPAGLRYASFRLDDGVSFVHVAEVTTSDGTYPLTATPAFQDFVREIGERCVDAPVASAATLVGAFPVGA